MTSLSEVRDMSNEQMAAVLKEACQTLFKLQIAAQTERLDVPSELARNRKLVARIKTIQREREIVGEKALAKAKAES